MVDQQADDADGSGSETPASGSEPETARHSTGASEGSEHASAQTHGSDHQGSADGRTTEFMGLAKPTSAGRDQGAPTVVQNRAVPEPQQAQQAPPAQPARPAVNIGEAVWKVASALATAVKVICYALAVVIVLFVLLTFVGVNPQNAVAQFLGSFAGAVVLDFRDLFLLPDPSVALVVNYGLAAVFWIVVGEVVSRVIRFVGAQFS